MFSAYTSRGQTIKQELLTWLKEADTMIQEPKIASNAVQDTEDSHYVPPAFLSTGAKHHRQYEDTSSSEELEPKPAPKKKGAKVKKPGKQKPTDKDRHKKGKLASVPTYLFKLTERAKPIGETSLPC